MAFSLGSINIAELKGEVQATLVTVEKVLTDLAPVEALLPLPASVKAFYAELTTWVEEAEKLLAEI